MYGFFRENLFFNIKKRPRNFVDSTKSIEGLFRSTLPDKTETAITKKHTMGFLNIR